MCHEFAGGLARIAGLLRIPKSKDRGPRPGDRPFHLLHRIQRSDTREHLSPVSTGCGASASSTTRPR